MNDIIKILKFKKETKNTYVYEDGGTNVPIPSLYIKKGYFPDSPPEEIQVTIGEVK